MSRQTDDVYQLIQLQASTGNSSESASFTINVAIWSPFLSTEKLPLVSNSHWHRRLGQLCPEHADLWWQADDLVMADRAAQDISLRIEAYALPLLERLKSTRDLLALWRSGESPGLTGVQAARFRKQLEDRARGA